MNTPSSSSDDPKPAGVQPALAPSEALHDQLYRYAEDLQQMVQRNEELERQYDALVAYSSKLFASGKELDAVIRSSRDIHLVTDVSGRILQANPAASILASQDKLIGASLSDWISPSHIERFQELLDKVVLHVAGVDEQDELQLEHLVGDAAQISTSVQVFSIREATGTQDLHWVIRDISTLRERELDNQVSSMVLNNASEGVMVADTEGRILAVNPAFGRITGYDAVEMIGQDLRILQSGRQGEQFYDEMWVALKATGVWQGRVYNKKKNGEIYPELLSISAAKDSDGKVLTYIGVFSDLSNLIEPESKIAQFAFYDSLTGLPNRMLLHDRMEQALATAERTGGSFTLLFIDLNQFKKVNDGFGHAVGDAVLQEVSRRMQAALEECDTLARLGGDEFIVLSPRLLDDIGIDQLCGRLFSALAAPLNIGGGEVRIGACLGCATYPVHGGDADTLLLHSDQAMYDAKKVGGNAYSIFGSGCVHAHGRAE
ncbi:MAG: diguanylate cyclase [Sideroxydans sp.]